jgi:hypothetical protein
MHRRTFQSGLLAAASLPHWAHARRPAPTPPPINAIAQIQALRIDSGPLTDGYRIAPNGRLNWYFTHLGLIAIVQYLGPTALDLYIRRHLDLYLARLLPNLSIEDVEFTDAGVQNFNLVPSDSDNSYAATFVSLAARYLKASGNWAWWDAHKAQLLAIVQANIVTQIKTNGLSRVFQAPRSTSISEYGFTMNNAEDYRGLRDLADIFALRGDSTQASTLQAHAHRIGEAMRTLLWDSERRGYKVSDQDLRADTRSFYPGSCCQVFAQANGVIECSGHDDAGYAFLNTWHPRWPQEVDDPFPWCILGFTAARRGDATRARLQQTSTERKYLSNPGLVTINELGYYQRTQSLLQGRPDV